MEIGNMRFGNSRGTVPVDRSLAQDVFNMIYDHIDEFDRIDNDVFTHRPYYWGDCTCGWDEKELEWEESHQHSEDCYHTKYNALPKDPFHTWRREEEEIKKLCAEYGIPWNNGYGCAVHCTCGREQERMKFVESGGHSQDCLLIQDNFIYKPTDLRIQWYKYPMRDSYSNRQFTRDELRRIINHCIKAVNDERTI